MSDHLSGPRALADPSSDICDIYAFPSPERSGHLVLVIDLFPFAGPTALFSDAVMCRFRLRPVTIAATGPAAFVVSEREIAFDCSFDRAGDAPRPAPKTCGGRSLNDDVMDTYYTLLI